MKNYIYTLSAMAIASSLAFAQDKPADPPKGGGTPAKGQRMNPEDSFKKLDTNSDGSLTLDEYKANPRFQKDASKAEESYKKMDANSDGKVTLDEYKAARATLRPGGKKGGAAPTPAPDAPK